MAPEIGLVISTMLEGIHRVQRQLPFGWSQVVVVHQIPGADKQTYADVYARLQEQGVQIITQDFRGLSKSRNAGLKAINCAYALITDDDVQFPADVIQRLQTHIQLYPTADILTCQIQTPEAAPFKTYPARAFTHQLRSIARVSSVEMCIKMAWHKSANVHFDALFGLGATFPTGEEFIFLHDALQSGAQAQYVPIVIAIHPMESSGKLLDAAQLINKGAMMKRVYGWMSPVYMFAFAWKKRAVFAQHATFFSAIRYMLQGSAKLQRHA